MLDLIAIVWVVLSIVVLAWTRANRYLVLATLGSILLACYFAASAWMNGALSVAVDDQSAQMHAQTATTFEALTVLAMSASAACMMIAWRRRPKRIADESLERTQGAMQGGTI